MKSESTGKTWEKTKLQNCVRHKSGRYYARLFLNGKEIWKSLKTSHFSVAEAKLAELQKEHRERKASEVDPGDARMTFGAAATLHLQELEERTSIKRSTRKYWREIHAALLKDWPELAHLELRKITPQMCRRWASIFAKNVSGSRFNNSVSLLRHIFNLGKRAGVIFANPAAELERVKVTGKRLELPTLAKFQEFVAEMRCGHGRDSKNCADLAEGMAYTGMRLGEATALTIGDVNFAGGVIRVAGDPEEGTKNREVREVPLIAQSKALFERMISEREKTKDEDGLFLVHECQKSMDRSAKKVGMKRITHHDLRHFFATVCIEKAVDIPTVSRWLGHKDGGALAMRTYGHLRREHSLAQAAKVSFIPAAEAA